MSKPRKHHIIPRMLLQHFTYKNKICLYDKEFNNYRLDQDIKNVCVQTNFYAENLGVEEHLSKVEGLAANSLENFKKDPETISVSDRENIAIFLTHIFLRTKHIHDVICKIQRTVMENEIICLISNPQNLHSEEDIVCAEDIKKRGFAHFNMTIPNELIISKMFDPEIVQEIYRKIYQMNWMLLEAPDDHFFIIGDAGIVRITPPRTRIGLDNPDIILGLPLSSKLLLIADWKNNKTKKAFMSTECLELFNSQSIVWSSREIFFNKKYYNKAQLLIEKYAKYKVEFNLDSKAVSSFIIQVERR